MNISKQNKHNKHNKYGKRIFSMLLAFVFIVTLLPQKANAVGRTPIEMLKDGRSNYWRWDQVDGKYDIPDDGKWHRMLLFFQYDEIDNKAHYLSGDASFRHERDNQYIKFAYYDQTKYAAGDSDIDLNDDYFYTETHRNGFFVKYVGHSAYDDNALIKLRTSDSNGKPGKYIGMNSYYNVYANNNRISFVDSESDAYTFKMMTSDSTEWTNRVGAGEILIWTNLESVYVALSDKVLDDFWEPGGGSDGMGASVNKTKRCEGAIGLRPFADSTTFSSYLKMKMYIGEPFSETYITTDFEVKAGASQTLSGETLIKPGVTVTVEEGGTLAINGALYNSGTINNNGTIVFNRDSTLAYYATNGAATQCDYSDQIIGGDFYCNKSATLIVCEGAKIILPKGLKMTGNSVCHNSGAMIFEDGLKMSVNATFYNRNIGLVKASCNDTSRYYQLKTDRPRIRSRQESTIQGDGGSIPVMKYWTESYVSMTQEAALGYLSYYSEKWFDISGNTKFYNEGTVQQNTFIYTDKGINWCEGNPPGVYSQQNDNDYNRALAKMKVGTVSDELRYNFIIPYKL